MTQERDLLRIITGRLQFSRDDLFLYIEDPGPSLKQKSFIIYDEIYTASMRRGIPTTGEMEELLIERNLWTPMCERKAEEIKEELDRLKVQAYENHFKPKVLRKLKASIRFLEREVAKWLGKRTQYSRETCEGLAEEERKKWLILNSVYDEGGNKYTLDSDEEEEILEYYMESYLSPDKIRELAKRDPWRTMWLVATKVGDLFDRPSSELSDYQLSLCSTSIMYDNVYQSPECPPDEVVMDNDCLDGWFIVQREINEERQKKRSTKTLFSEKVGRHDEVYVKVNDAEEAVRVMDLNNDRSKQIIGQRANKINESGEKVKQGEFDDVRASENLKANQKFVQQMRGRK